MSLNKKTLSFIKRMYPSVDKTVFKPFITVSREAGSGGRPIARLLAKELGFDFYDEHLVDLTAGKLKKRRELVASLDEQQQGIMQGIIALLTDTGLSKDKYIHGLCEVIVSLAQKGNCVILGRGANFITPFGEGLHVRVIAPFLTRVGYTASYEGYSKYEANQRVRHFDRERKEFIKRYFSKNPSNTNYYDLTINTAYFNIEQAVKVILKAYKRKFKKRK
ncbi:cytidylate kinase-like family protein [Patescibacteria group bacterium]|nr:cytidylate kinase-like family protein [Patescibacteria group bacterium]MBU1931524.1 cytidylate kinase-like family protein [Patescibacteria group bacterium]